MSAVTSHAVGLIAAGEGHLLIRDRRYVPDATAIPVVYCHQATADYLSTRPQQDTGLTPYYVSRILIALAALGHPVISSDQSGPSHWGADPAPQRVTDALAYIGTRLGCRTNRVLLMGVSMGTVLALNWARANPTLVAGVAVLLPVVNLRSAHDNAPAPLPANIETAYGGSAGYLAAATAHNPAENTASHAGKPIRLWYSTDDPTALASEVTAFSAATGATAVSLGAKGHALDASLDPMTVASWLSAQS